MPGVAFTFRKTVCLIAAVCLLLSLSSCAGGIPSGAESGRERLKSLGYANEITYETYPRGSRQDGAIAVLLYTDADVERFAQAILYETEEAAKAAYEEKAADDLLVSALEPEGENSLARVGNWVLLAPTSVIDAFAGGKAESAPEASA